MVMPTFRIKIPVPTYSAASCLVENKMAAESRNKRLSTPLSYANTDQLSMLWNSLLSHRTLPLTRHFLLVLGAKEFSRLCCFHDYITIRSNYFSKPFTYCYKVLNHITVVCHSAIPCYSAVRDTASKL
jgi:hypothetical protein